MLDHLEQFARLLSEEAGKPIKDARTEVERTAMTFRIAAEEAERISGEVIDLGLNQVSRGRIGIARRFPAGPVAGISPFNLPLSLAAHKLAPAMAAGCPIVLKIPSQTPLALLKLARAPSRQPVVRFRGRSRWRRCRSGSATGSSPTTGSRCWIGRGGPRRLGHEGPVRPQRVILELGGNAGALVDSSADLDSGHPPRMRAGRLPIRRADLHQRAAGLRARPGVGRVHRPLRRATRRGCGWATRPEESAGIGSADQPGGGRPGAPLGRRSGRRGRGPCSSEETARAATCRRPC